MTSRMTPDSTMTVLVYSDDLDTRTKIMMALGRRPAADLPRITYRECATAAAVFTATRAGGLDLCVLDGEATPAGGMGLCRQLKDEIYQCPPILVATGRADDAWLATWSRADASVPHPLDPVLLAHTVTELMHRVAEAPPVSH